MTKVSIAELTNFLQIVIITRDSNNNLSPLAKLRKSIKSEGLIIRDLSGEPILA